MKARERWPDVSEALRVWRERGFGPFDEWLDRPVRDAPAPRVVAERYLGLDPLEAYDAAEADFKRRCSRFGSRPSCDGCRIRTVCRRNSSIAADLATWLMLKNEDIDLGD